MAWWIDLTQTVWQLLEEHGLLMAFMLLFLEESGIPPLIPGDFLMILVGVRAAEGRLHLIDALAVLELATVLGGSVLYWVSVFGGHALVERLGPYVGATPERLERASRALRRHGERAIILGRIIPSLCILTAVVSGALDFPYRRFLPALAVGGFLHLVLFVMLGYLVGPPIVRVAARLHLPFELLASTVLLLAFAFWVARASRRAHADPAVHAPLAVRLRAGLLAGLLGAIASMLLVNVLIHLAGLLAYEAPSRTLLASGLVGHSPAQALVLAMTPAFVILPTLWGLLYGVWSPHLPGPGWARGALFSVLPLAASLLVVLPMLGAGPFGTRLGEGPVPALGETARYLAYGLALGSSFPVLTPRSSRERVW